MKIIFLDIDGVLNSDIWYKSQKLDESAKNALLHHLDPHAVHLLNKIVSKTKAKIVLSTTWRLHYSIEAIQKIFIEKGFTGDIIGKTPDLVNSNDNFIRGNEILKWCKDNENIIGKKYYNFKSYAIIDDKNDMLYWHKNNFFQTDRYCGLTPSKASEIIKFFSE